MKIIARSAEIEVLDKFLESRKPEFMTVYGRRRVGKTFLIKNFFPKKKCVFFSITGVEKGDFLEQRNNFCKRISEVFYHNIPLVTPKGWYEIFDLLNKAIEATPKDQKIVLFFDEFPWMVTPRSKLLQVLEYYWNEYWGNNERIKLIICGSLASWIIKNIIKNTKGLYQRVTYRLKVEPFNLHQTELFFKSRKLTLSQPHILNLYMVTGGIPLYLEQVEKGLSANEIIDKLCFNRNGLLFNELKELYKSLFKEANIYLRITKEIAQYRDGISNTQLASKIKHSHGGRLTERLEELEDAGFIMSLTPYSHKERGKFFKISDEYTMFYFKWIAPNISSINNFTKSEGFWLEKTHEGSYQAWKGYAFEAICYKHINQIMKALNIKTTSVPYAWRYITKRKNKSEVGCQIDLLFDRTDDAITLCEIKYSSTPYVIDKNYAKILINKKEIFVKKTKTTKQIFTALISVNGVKENLYSEDLVDKTVVLNDLFR